MFDADAMWRTVTSVAAAGVAWVVRKVIGHGERLALLEQRLDRIDSDLKEIKGELREAVRDIRADVNTLASTKS